MWLYPWASPALVLARTFVTWTPEAAAEGMVVTHPEAKRGDKRLLHAIYIQLEFVVTLLTLKPNLFNPQCLLLSHCISEV